MAIKMGVTALPYHQTLLACTIFPVICGQRPPTLLSISFDKDTPIYLRNPSRARPEAYPLPPAHEQV